jgi:hypothetical protein
MDGDADAGLAGLDLSRRVTRTQGQGGGLRGMEFDVHANVGIALTDARDPYRDICRQAEARKSKCWQPVEVLQFLNFSISHNNGIRFDTPKKNSLLNNSGPAN